MRLTSVPRVRRRDRPAEAGGLGSPTGSRLGLGRRAATHAGRSRSGPQFATAASQGLGFLPVDVMVDAGDTVRRVARSSEIHTVTFLAGGGTPATAARSTPPT